MHWTQFCSCLAYSPHMVKRVLPFIDKWKLNEWGFRPLSSTYRQNWTRRTSWAWWDEWDDTALQTQDSKFEPWRSESEHATSLSLTEAPRNIASLQMSEEERFCFFETWRPDCSRWPSRPIRSLRYIETCTEIRALWVLTLVLLNCFNFIFSHLKLELLTQFPASNNKNFYYLWKIDMSKIKLLDHLSIY